MVLLSYLDHDVLNHELPPREVRVLGVSSQGVATV